MLRTILFVFSIVLLFSLVNGCSGKTTVKEELIDKTPRPAEKGTTREVETAQPTTEQPESEEKKEETSETTPTQSQTPSVEQTGENSSTFQPSISSGSETKPEKEGGKEAREKYYQDNLIYPGSEPYSGPTLPDSPGFTGRTLISKDPAGTIAAWYMNKFGEKATMNQTRSGQGEEYRIEINDKENGYRASILIHKLDQNNPSRILISLYDL